MSEPAAIVGIALAGGMHRVGRLWVTSSRTHESATFEYDDSWLANPERFALEPALQLYPGPFQTRAGQPMFGALGDSAPDRWGRTLIARAERRRARNEAGTPRTLRELDYLLAVNDEVRQGSLRFALTEDGPYVAATLGIQSVPPLVSLPRLLNATQAVLDDDESAEDLRLLLAPGASLGGARPKASVRDTDNSLLIAKFPAKNDPYNLVLWEAIALELARRAGIAIPNARVVQVSHRNVLLVNRFDRVDGNRIPFLSTMSALGATDREVHSYMEIADALRPYAAAAREDLASLWRRMVFNVLISNTDDHLRNHAFVYVGRDGWRLAPAYDINPVPTDIKPRMLSTSIAEDYDLTASLELALEVAEHFGLKPAGAQALIGEVHRSVKEWRNVAMTFGVKGQEIERMSTAFEHEDAELAASLA
ncbi:MAG: type II toxin-antitoxin system HipA family toxin [Gemmatimonadota bacterium]